MHLTVISQASGFSSTFILPPKQEVTTCYQLSTLVIFIDEIGVVIVPLFARLGWDEMDLILNCMRDTNRAVYNPIMETLMQVILTRKLQNLVQINFNLAKALGIGKGKAKVVWFKVKNNVNGQSTINQDLTVIEIYNAFILKHMKHR